MEGEVRASLQTWESFNVIVGSSGAALTGLQFVVIALVAESRRRSTLPEISAYGTPTIVHFTAVLFIAAILSAPWQTFSSVGFLLAACGFIGFAYSLVVLKRARQQVGYKPVLEDWIWFTILPKLAYLALFVSGLLLPTHPTRMLFIISSSMLLLLFIGIHNAWDSVTFIATGGHETIHEKQSRPRK